MIFNRTKKELVRTGDLAPKGIARTVDTERTDYNTTFQHIYKNLKQIR